MGAAAAGVAGVACVGSALGTTGNAPCVPAGTASAVLMSLFNSRTRAAICELTALLSGVSGNSFSCCSKPSRSEMCCCVDCVASNACVIGVAVLPIGIGAAVVGSSAFGRP